MKYCSKCKTEKPTTCFGKWSHAPDGLKNWCRDCIRQDRRSRRGEAGLPTRLERDPADAASGLKICTHCRELKSLDQFSPQKRSRDGHASWCKACKLAAEQERLRQKGIPKKRRRDPALLADGLKECFGTCQRTLPLSEFDPCKRGVGGVSAWCRDCRSSYSRENQGRQSAYMRKWRKDNPRYLFLHRAHQSQRKARQRNADTGRVTQAFLEDLYQTSTCVYCQRKVAEEKRTMDHVIPLSRGGLHDPDNLVMACGSCNSRKGAMTGDEYRRKLESGISSKGAARLRQSGGKPSNDDGTNVPSVCASGVQHA